MISDKFLHLWSGVKLGYRFVIVRRDWKYTSRLNFDSTAFASPKYYIVAADFDSAYQASVNVAELDAATTSATSVGVAAV